MASDPRQTTIGIIAKAAIGSAHLTWPSQRDKAGSAFSVWKLHLTVKQHDRRSQKNPRSEYQRQSRRFFQIADVSRITSTATTMSVMMTLITCFLSQGAIHAFCGALTTFSAFAYESMAYWHEGKFDAFVLNLFANNLLCFVAVMLGIGLHRG
jgi:hypothetical protein